MKQQLQRALVLVSGYRLLGAEWLSSMKHQSVKDWTTNFRKTLIGGVAVIGFASLPALADAVSYTGALATPTNIFDQSFTIPNASMVTIQTYGFGGGTNAAGVVIPPGGFDPIVALFSGNASSSATILTDSAGNPIVSADNH